MKKIIILLFGTVSLWGQFIPISPTSQRGVSPTFAFVGPLSNIPAHCKVAQLAFITDANPGTNIYDCTSINVWTQQAGGGGGGGGGGANTALSNLSNVNINTTLLAQTGVDLGSTLKPFRNLFIYGSGVYANTYFKITGTPTAGRTWNLQDQDDTFVGRDTVDTLTGKTFNTAFNTFYINGVFINGTSGTGNILCLTTNCVMTTPNLGTPSTLVLTNATGLPVVGGGTGAATAANALINLFPTPTRAVDPNIVATCT